MPCQRHSVGFTEQLLNLSKKEDNCLDITAVMTRQPAFPPFGSAPFLLLNDHDCSEQPHCCLSMRHSYLADTAAFSNNQRQKTCRKTNMPLGSSNLSFPEQSKQRVTALNPESINDPLARNHFLGFYFFTTSKINNGKTNSFKLNILLQSYFKQCKCMHVPLGILLQIIWLTISCIYQYVHALFEIFV